LMIGEVGGVLITTFITTVMGIIGTGIIKDIFNMPILLDFKTILTNYAIQVGSSSLYLSLSVGALALSNPFGIIVFSLITLFAAFFDLQTFLFVRSIFISRRYIS
jgi:hypothetical protein